MRGTEDWRTFGGIDADAILEGAQPLPAGRAHAAPGDHAARSARRMMSRAPEGAGKTAEALFAIVLAAGASTRFGSSKQLVRIAGRPLLHTAVTRASEVTGSALIVVLGSGAAELGALLKHSPDRSWSTTTGGRDWPVPSAPASPVCRSPAAARCCCWRTSRR